MASFPAVLGASLAWLLLVALSAAAGMGLIAAWRRWGSRVPVPQPAVAVVHRLLGPPARDPRVAGAGRETATSGALSMAASSDHWDAERSTAFVADEAATGSSAPPAGVAAAGEPSAGGEPEEQPNAPPEPAGEPEAIDEHVADPSEPAAPEEEQPVVTVGSARLSRAEAIEELSALFGFSYEESVSFVESGLWGLDNHEEWSRAARSGQAPAGVDAALVQRVVARSSGDVAKELEEFRAKRFALAELESLWGVGPDEARALYDAGFATTDAIRIATTEKLARVDGIGRTLAFQIRAAAHGLAPTP